ncbi:hypothetical protein [Streptacidiphilus sp. MAP5-52]|uniref:hypothetical protein n=1 Tax=Streptacidiphilus sp. MAP5-52 TaxID=3156267 RepID=UPI003518CBE2
MSTWLKLADDSLVRGSVIGGIDVRKVDWEGGGPPSDRRRIVVLVEHWGAPPQWKPVGDCSAEVAPFVVARLARELAKPISSEGHLLFADTDESTGLVTSWSRDEPSNYRPFIPNFHGGPSTNPDLASARS